MNVEPLHDYLLVEIIEDDTGVVKTEDVRDTKQKGKVLAAGPGRMTEHGRFITPSVEAGDIVYWEEQAEADTPKQLKNHDPELALVKYSQLIAREK